jgi:superoxide dismutase, Fe-Mn family
LPPSAGTDLDNKSPLDVAIATARQADLATVFNLASQAHNNHFFFRNLSPVQTVMPARLAELVRRVFTTPENFKTEFTTTAASLFGSGWVWLVFDESRKLRILATYNAGTPYSDAYRRQNVDLNTNADPARYTTNFQESFQIGRTGNQVNRVTYPLPLLCCKVWEHAWIQDFGVDGKEKYLDAWWDSIDWNSVDAAIPEGSDITRSRLAFERAGSQFGATGFVNE